MKIQFELTNDDWIEFQKDYLSRSKQYQRIRFWTGLISPIIIFFYGLYGCLEKGSHYSGLIVYALFSVILIVFLPHILDSSVLKTLNRQFKEEDFSALMGNHVIKCTDEFLLLINPGSENKTLWKKFIKYEENEKYIFIYLTGNSAVIIPKYKATPREDLDRILSFIRSKTRIYPDIFGQNKKEKGFFKYSFSKMSFLTWLLVFLVLGIAVSLSANVISSYLTN